MIDDSYPGERAICEEAVRRYVKGLPPDRWHDGVNGEARFMRALRRVLNVQDELAAMVVNLHAELERLQGSSIKTYKDPARGSSP